MKANKRIRKNICITPKSIKIGEKLVKKGKYKSFSRMLELAIESLDEKWEDDNVPFAWTKKYEQKETIQ